MYSEEIVGGLKLEVNASKSDELPERKGGLMLEGLIR